MPNPSDKLTRRAVLGSSGLMIGASGLIPTVAAVGNENNSNGNNGNKNSNNRNNRGGQNTCPDGSVLLAKYEVRGREFRFEKDSDYLNVGDTFEFTVTERKDDGDILAFKVEDPRGVYDIHTLSVKAGPNVFRKSVDDTSGTFDVREFGDSRGVSNVLICAQVWWQIDFGRGDVPEPPRYDIEDLPYAATGSGTSDSINNPSVYRNFLEYVNVEKDALSIDLDAGTATIEFSENTTEMHLASFETPGEFRRDEIEFQQRFNVAFTTAKEGTLTIDIPTVDDYTDR